MAKTPKYSHPQPVEDDAGSTVSLAPTKEERIPGFSGFFGQPAARTPGRPSASGSANDIPPAIDNAVTVTKAALSEQLASNARLGDEMCDIPVDLIDPSPYQPRLRLNPDALHELAGAIGAIGKIMTPLRVRPMPNGRFELIAGERRWTAAKIVGLATVPAWIRNLNDHEARKEAVLDNFGDDDLSPYERAKVIRTLLNDWHEKLDYSDVAAMTSLSKTMLSFHMAFFDLPQDVIDLLEDHPGLLGITHARGLAQLCKEGAGETVSAIAKQVASGDVPLNNIVERVKRALRQAPSAKASDQPPPRGDKRHFVTLTGKGICTLKRMASGRITIAPASAEESEALDKVITKAIAEYIAAGDRET